MNSPHEHFTDESIIKPEGVPIEYVRPTFERPAAGLEVEEITWEEYVATKEAIKGHSCTCGTTDNYHYVDCIRRQGV